MEVVFMLVLGIIGAVLLGYVAATTWAILWVTIACAILGFILGAVFGVIVIP